MKLIYIPSNCPKCDNTILVEKLQDKKGAKAYCKHCDFILPIDKEELEYVEEYLVI